MSEHLNMLLNYHSDPSLLMPLEFVIEPQALPHKSLCFFSSLHDLKGLSSFVPLRSKSPRSAELVCCAMLIRLA